MLTFENHQFGTLRPHERFGPVRWSWFDLFWVHSGKVVLRIMDRRDLTLIGGSGVLIFPQTEFVGQSLMSSSLASVQHFDLEQRPTPYPRPLQRLLASRGGVEVYQIQATDPVEQDIERAVNLHFQPPSPALHVMREAITMLILAELESRIVQEPITHPRRATLDGLSQWLERQLHRDVSLEEMAEHVNLSPSYFRAVFRDQFGISPGRFFNNMRFEKAARLLRETDLPIKRVASDIGYRDLPNFYRAFRSHLGLTPAAYRGKHATIG